MRLRFGIDASHEVLLRWAAYTFLAGILLVIYQIVFMARTSASRDWNHIHNMRLSLPATQRLALRGPNGSEIHEWTRLIEQNIGLREEQKSFPKYFRPSGTGQPSQWPAKLTFVNASACDGTKLRMHPYAGVFAFEHEKRSKRNRELFIQRFDVHVAHYTEQRSIVEEVSDALRSGKKAVVYVVPSRWTPVYGVQFFEIPVVAVRTLPPRFDRLELGLDEAAPRSWKPLEWVVHGFTNDAIIVGDSRQTPESTARFLELARVFKRLTRLGWKPLRSIHFVSFPRFSAPHWSKLHGVSRNAIAYVDCGALNRLQDNKVMASPSVAGLVEWAANQLVDAGLIAPPAAVRDHVYSSYLGSGTFLLDYQIPSIAAAIDPPASHVQFLALVVTTLSQDPVLPLAMAGYAPYIHGVGAATERFDQCVEDLRFNFTREYPWYQGGAKLRSILQRKRANLIMSHIEKLLAIRDDGDGRDGGRNGGHNNGRRGLSGVSNARHLLFSIDKSGTKFQLNENQTQIGGVVHAIREELAAFS